MGWLSALGAVPLVGALAVAATPRQRPDLAKIVALFTSLLALALTAAIVADFEAGDAGFQFVEQARWID